MALAQDCLLDTSALLFLMAGDSRFPASTLKLLAETAGTVFYSPVNLIEIQIKYQLGKLPLPKPPGDFFPAELPKYEFARLELSTESIFAMQQLPLIHRDPFDRLLLAQALVENCFLISPDALLRKYPVPVRWD
jgi:PIN domain nuclease of toxin-antitoxin system